MISINNASRGAYVMRLCYALAIIATLSGCSVKYISTPIPLPALYPIPKLTNSELSCLSDITYRKIAILKLHSDYNTDLLTSVIKSTWNDE